MVWLQQLRQLSLAWPVMSTWGQKMLSAKRLNVFRMEMMGATVHAVETGTKTLKDAVDDCFWSMDGGSLDAFYVLGSAVGPHPYPTIVHEFQKVISEESKRQILEKEGRLPDYVIACVGGGSNALCLLPICGR